MRQMPIPSLQPDWGILCLWVTGRAMELGRELFQQWGYRRVDELVWVKTSQLGRLIRTGRTGHWLKWVPPPSSLPFPFLFFILGFSPVLLLVIHSHAPASQSRPLILIHLVSGKSEQGLTNSHTCEHLLVALKIPASHPANDPIPWDTHPTLQSLRKGIDTDVVVAEVRETSRKPDEVYGVIERYVPLPPLHFLRLYLLFSISSHKSGA